MRFPLVQMNRPAETWNHQTASNEAAGKLLGRAASQISSAHLVLTADLNRGHVMGRTGQHEQLAEAWIDQRLRRWGYEEPAYSARFSPRMCARRSAERLALHGHVGDKAGVRG
jgi:hypothetical protein